MPNSIHGIKCCPLGIRGYGDPTSGLMFVGIHPGPEEMKSGRPDTGQAGQLMDQCVLSGGWEPTNTYHTNLICHNAAVIDKATIAACKPRLLAEIEVYRPHLIVFFGAIPAGEFGIKKRGYMNLKTYPYPHWELYTYHPAAVLHGQNGFVYDIMRDLAKIPRIMSMPPALTRPEYSVVTDPTIAQYVMDTVYKPSVEQGHLLAMDIETRLHNPNEDEVEAFDDIMRCMSVYDGVSLTVFTKPSLQGVTWPTSPRIIYHNGQFDTIGLRQYADLDLPITHDTCLGSYAGDEYSGTFEAPRKGQNKLETLVGEYFGDTEYKEETKKSWRKHIEPPDQALWQRNAYDSYYTWHLHPVLQQLRPPFPAYEQLLIPAANMFSEIVERGAYVSQPAMSALIREWGPQYAELILQVKDHVNNPRSWQQLSKYLYGPIEDGGLALSGGPSTAAKVLRDIDHPFAKNVVQLRELSYRMQHWIVGLKQHIKHDGRLHPNVLLHGPETGRRAYHKPPLQTIPKHGEQLSRIRTLFAATTDDYVIMEADYSQIEVWVGAYLSGDTALLADLQSGDVHSATAVRLGLDPSDDLMRQVGKTTNFLMQYGGGGGKLQQTLAAKNIHVSLAFCNNVVSTWRKAYPRYAQWTEEIWQQIQNEGLITTPFGRVRRCPLVTDPSWRATFINWPVQSTAGDYTLTSMLSLHKQLAPYDSYILFDVHDSIVMEVNKAHLPDVVSLVRHVMQAPRVGLPGVKVEISIGPDMYDTHKLKEVA